MEYLTTDNQDTIWLEHEGEIFGVKKDKVYFPGNSWGKSDPIRHIEIMLLIDADEDFEAGTTAFSLECGGRLVFDGPDITIEKGGDNGRS